MGIPLFSAYILLLIHLFAATAFCQNIPVASLVPVDDTESLDSILTVSPREINLGTLGPGEEAKGTSYLKNVGTGIPEWFATGPQDWTLAEQQHLSGRIGQVQQPLRIHLTYLKETGTSLNRTCSLMLRLEAGDYKTALRREVPIGDLREEIRFHYDGGTASLYFHVNLMEMPAAPLLDLEPLRMDFGTIGPGKQITKKILLKNRGRESLKWRSGIAGGRGMPPTAPSPVGRFVSFKIEPSTPGIYSSGVPAVEGMELSGNWEEEGGYPSGQGEQCTLRYRFSGTGISILFWKSPDGGPFSVFLDEQFVSLVDGFAERRERAEALIFEEQPEGFHTLAIVNGEGRAILEGLRVFGNPVRKGPRGWISVFPDSGFTTRETDYINVSVNAGQLAPGIYGDRLFFLTNGGDAEVEVYLEVTTEKTPKFLDVHRYRSGTDYLYTTRLQDEASKLQLTGYQYAGIAFRLFAPGTPGTTHFYCWFNPSKRDHYYSYDPQGGKPLPGYQLEGSIGNIATSRLSGTKELYRWFSPATGGHFYTTDMTGEGAARRGYRFDGIAGFVR